MTSTVRVDWDRFQDLPGAATTNFEALCRALVRLQYSRFGTFRATAQMPGIEFHLKLDSDCPLGNAGDWFGWQCRWYGLGRGKSLGTTRRAKILQAIRTTEKHVPNLTHWVLWTRHPLTKGDEKWFYDLRSKFQLRAWDESNAEDLLGGDALMLRATYFGEWVLRPEALADHHDRAVSSIRTRWLHEAHQEVEAERTLLRILGEATSWNEMIEVAELLADSARAIRRGTRPTMRCAAETKAFIAVLETWATTLRVAPALLAKGDFDLLQETLEQRPEPLSADMSALPRRLRASRLSINFHASNGLEYCKWGARLLDQMQECLSIRLHAVLADAGGGKTQLAAELTAPRPGRPAGVLLHGRDLKSGDNLDDLARTFVIAGKPMPSFEALVGALDAASQRARRRLPLVIDGLNEAEDPRNWKKPLSEAETLLKKFPGVLLVVTLRTGAWRPSDDQRYFDRARHDEGESERTVFVRIALPEGTPLVEMDGFGMDADDAVARYFRHFRINAQASEVATDLLAHPLTLRLFCEVTNPPPQTRDVGPEALPRSLVQLFERYLARAVERIGEFSPREQPYSGHDVRRALNKLAIQLWVRNSRELDQDSYRELIGDDGRLWNQSLVRLMEQEGLILRVGKASDGNYGVIPVYDAIGGYLIANALLAGMGRVEFAAWIQRPETVGRFRSEKWEDLHPMASDVFKALVSLVPRRFQQEQLWNLVPDPLRRAALIEATDLEGDLVDQATVREIARIVRDPAEPGAIFDRLAHARSIPKHPFNASFLDAQLRAMTNAERDLRWSEKIRMDYEQWYRGLPRVGEQWEKDISPRQETDRLCARWMMWRLTSSAYEIRHKYTRALYWFGRGDPQALFSLTLDSLSISDPYVPERMLAASYGVVMYYHGAKRDPAYETTTLKNFALALYGMMFAQGAPHATTHILMREYARRTIEVAQQVNKSLLTATEEKRVLPPFPKDLHRKGPEIELERGERIPAPSPLGMDFENYTLGGLVPKRGNYDFKHPEYRKVVAQVLARIRELGWTEKAFSSIDRTLSSDRYGWRGERSGSRKIDSYGEKYAWIAYHEQAGRRTDLGLIEASHWGDSDRSSDVDIDPSFPQAPGEERLPNPSWLAGAHKTLSAWIARGPVPDTSPLLRRESIFSEDGPWLRLDGFFTQQDKVTGRRIFCFVRGILVPENDRKEIVSALEAQSMRGRWLPEKPSEIYAYAGEFPWCATFGATHRETLHFVTERESVTVLRRRTVLNGNASVEEIDQALGLLRSGKPVPDALMAKVSSSVRTELVPSQEVREKTIDFKVTMPVCDFHWEGQRIDDESTSGMFLAKQIAQALKLRWVAGTHDLADASGRRATYNTTFGNDSREDSQKAFFVREDLLLSYLRRTKMALVWVSWGERGFSDNLSGHISENRKDFGELFKVFHTVKTYNPTKG